MGLYAHVTILVFSQMQISLKFKTSHERKKNINRQKKDGIFLNVQFCFQAVSFLRSEHPRLFMNLDVRVLIFRDEFVVFIFATVRCDVKLIERIDRLDSPRCYIYGMMLSREKNAAVEAHVIITWTTSAHNGGALPRDLSRHFALPAICEHTARISLVQFRLKLPSLPSMRETLSTGSCRLLLRGGARCPSETSRRRQAG